MNKKLTLLVLGFLIFTGAQSIAQEKGKIRVGSALVIGTETGLADDGGSKLGVGLNFGGDYFIMDNLSISPSYSFFFESSYSEIFESSPGFSPGLGAKYSSRFSVFNIDGKYYFSTEHINLYGLLGLTLTREKTGASYINVPNNIDLIPNPDVINNNTGLNIGVGVDLGLSDKIYLNSQINYNTPLEQLVINFGVGFVFN
ncbi:MAG: outer membrane beta-barrel protein [Cyclobacteriaceae bacterium]|nr:outer membrane beta-barrel protein [Cyclobacteriaceae bacterium]